MRIETAIDIDAPAEVVWQILVDFAAYGDWNPFTSRVKGEPALGEVVRLHVRMGDRNITRKHVISAISDGQLSWTIRTRKPWMLRGERHQRVEALGPDRCRYTNDEGVFGLTSWPVALLFKRQIHEGLEAVGVALKSRAERSR